MKKFAYTAVNKKGEKINGEMEANTPDEVANILIETNLSPVKINEKLLLLDFINNSLTIKKVPLKEKVVFFREFSTMVSAGLAIDDSLEVSIAQTSNKIFKDILMEITKDVRAGSSLAVSMGKYPMVFKPIEISLVKAGEVSGKLDTILTRLASDVENRDILGGKVRGALSYPAFILTIAVIVVGVITVKLVPAMQSLYAGFGASSLPIPTEILVGISNFLTHDYLFLIIFLILAYASYRYYVARPEGRIARDSLLLKLPILGDILAKYQVVTFIKTYSMLLASGIPVVNALNLVSDSMTNELYSKSIREITKDVEKGVSLAQSMSKYEFIPPILPRSIAVGEETGKTEEILTKIGNYFEVQVNDKVNNLTRLIEPVLLVVLGTMVGFIAISIYLPIYTFSTVIH